MDITSSELRSKFINFFKNYPGFEHQVIPSAPLIPSDEEQLEGKEKVLFTSAGMQPLIPYLIGKKDPPSNRLVDCQKCIRTDDIEEVGDNTHHTFFEMLGNWSIGDYWKKEAIEMSFKFLTEELGISKEKLAVSVFAGDEDAPRDDESANVWKSLGISEERISYLGKEDNWWPTSRRNPDGTLKNAFGPCGPDTEMFYWTGEGNPEAKPEDDDRWVELWNDVFMQYNRKEDGKLEDLPQRNVDTGMGFERTLAVLNGVKSNYDTDLFRSIVETIFNELLHKHKYGETKEYDRAIKIISDHIRSIVFIASEDVEPSNKERGYILRRLIRRAVTQNYLKGEKDSSISVLVGNVVAIYGSIYPNIIQKKESIRQIIVEEETRAKRTLDIALKEWGKWFKENYTVGVGSQLPGAFLVGDGGEVKIPPLTAEKMFDLYQSYGLDPEIMNEVAQGNFDWEGFNKLFKEHQEKSRGNRNQIFKGGLAGHSEIETTYHTVTHLLHQALRDVLGQTVFQKGSNITPERLRFDFSFDRKVTEEELKQVEEIVNQRIKQDLKVDHMMMNIEEARKLNAIGLFNEKYSDNVSIYAAGPNFEYDEKAKDKRVRGGYYSLEFCGGPHVEYTGVIGGVKIVKEEAVSAGVRRIRAELI